MSLSFYEYLQSFVSSPEEKKEPNSFKEKNPLYKDCEFSDPSWVHYSKLRRLTKESIDWKVFDDPWPFQVRQGNLGDCQLIAPLITIARKKELLEWLLPNNKDALETGEFQVRLFVENKWKIVTIDGCLPVTESGNILYCYSGNQLWAKLIEKAVAKEMGGYEQILELDLFKILEMLTGFASTVINIDKTMNQDELWNKLKEYISSGFSLVAGTFSEDDWELYQEKGLSARHAYVVHQVFDYEGHRLIRIGSTFTAKWNGKWSKMNALENDSKQWSESDRDLEKRRNFWIEIDDFCRWFTSVYVCHYQPGLAEIRVNKHNIAIVKNERKRILQLKIKNRCQMSIDIIVSNSPFYHGASLINIHESTRDKQLGKIAKSFHSRNKIFVIEPFYLDSGNYLIVFVSVADNIDTIKWVIRSETIGSISHEIVLCSPRTTAISLQQLVLSNNKLEKKIEDGVIVNSYFEGDLIFLIAENSTADYVYLQPIVAKISQLQFCAVLIHNPDEARSIADRIKGIQRSPYHVIPPKSRRIIGCLWLLSPCVWIPKSSWKTVFEFGFRHYKKSTEKHGKAVEVKDLLSNYVPISF